VQHRILPIRNVEQISDSDLKIIVVTKETGKNLEIRELQTMAEVPVGELQTMAEVLVSPDFFPFLS